MSSSDTISHDEAIGQFCGVTGADEERAKGLLEACDWNLELAINMHVDTDPEGRSINKKSSTSSNSSAGPSKGANSGRNSTKNNKVVQIDNDDDDEDDDDDEVVSNPILRRPNSSRRGGGSSSSNASTSYQDEVRPPIPPVRQVLVQNPVGYSSELPARRYNTRTGPVSDVYDAFRDFQAEAQWQEMAQEGTSELPTTDANNKKRTLQELFRPPLELMFHGSLASAREVGTLQNKWLLVNIQNGREFACQILNRDVWSNQTVKDIVKEQFIFWQVYHDSFEGQRYVQFYKVTKLPHVAIVDPRTGEQMRSWPTTIDHSSFCDSVVEFLALNPSPDGSKDGNAKKLCVKDDEDQVVAPKSTLYDQSEEAQLEAAIKASLRESEKPTNNDDVIDIDEDTIEVPDIYDQQQIDLDKELIEKSHREKDNKPNVTPTTGKNQQQSSKNSNGQADQPTNDVNQHLNQAAALSAALAAKPPAKIDGPECKIALRFPDGSSLVHKFPASVQLVAVKTFVQIGKTTSSASEIEFIAPPNRKLTASMMNETLESLGLCPASRLEVKVNP